MPVLIHATQDMYTCMLWFNFILGLIFISLCFKLIIIYYDAPKQREIKIKPRIKLNHNIYKQSFFRIRSSNPAKQMFSNQAIGLWHQKGVNTTYQRNKTLFTVKRIIRRNPNGNFICWLYTRSLVSFK